MSWIDVGGLGDVELLRPLGQHFRIHPPALEDAWSTGQRPKVDKYEEQLLILLQIVDEDEGQELVFEQQVSPGRPKSAMSVRVI